MHTSPWPSLQIPKCNILSYLFSDPITLSSKPKWIIASKPSENISLPQMLSLIKRFAVGLDKLGIGGEQVVMVLAPNHLYIPVIYLATAGSKRYFTAANPDYTINEVATQMTAVKPAILFVHEKLVEIGVAVAKQSGLSLDRLFLLSGEHEAAKVTRGLRSWWSMLASETESASWRWHPLEGEVAAQTTAVINFSSGTTGVPKGVCITHHNLVANTAQAIFNHQQGLPLSCDRQDEKWLAFLPLYHAYSQLFTINVACKLPVTVYIMAKFAFEDFLKYVERYRITTLHAVPPILVMLVKRPETTKYNISSVEYLVCGAAPLSRDLQNQAMKHCGFTVCQAFGMSETTCAAFMTPPSHKDVTGSIGNLLPNTLARLVDETGKEVVGDGVPGELYLKGPQMMLGYWNNTGATQETTTSDGWLKTGDIATTRAGKWWIVDRIKELIKVNGLQVAPAELEAVLLEHSSVADAAVAKITIHDEEMPRAYIVVQEGLKGKVVAEDLQSFVAGRVAKHKALNGGVKFVSAIPKLASGKIMRKTLRIWAAEDVKTVERSIRARL